MTPSPTVRPPPTKLSSQTTKINMKLFIPLIQTQRQTYRGKGRKTDKGRLTGRGPGRKTDNCRLKQRNRQEKALTFNNNLPLTSYLISLDRSALSWTFAATRWTSCRLVLLRSRLYGPHTAVSQGQGSLIAQPLYNQLDTNDRIRRFCIQGVQEKRFFPRIFINFATLPSPALGCNSSQ